MISLRILWRPCHYQYCPFTVSPKIEFLRNHIESLSYHWLKSQTDEDSTVYLKFWRAHKRVWSELIIRKGRVVAQQATGTNPHVFPHPQMWVDGQTITFQETFNTLIFHRTLNLIIERKDYRNYRHLDVNFLAWRWFRLNFKKWFVGLDDRSCVCSSSIFDW